MLFLMYCCSCTAAQTSYRLQTNERLQTSYLQALICFTRSPSILCTAPQILSPCLHGGPRRRPFGRHGRRSGARFGGRTGLSQNGYGRTYDIYQSEEARTVIHCPWVRGQASSSSSSSYYYQYTFRND